MVKLTEDKIPDNLTEMSNGGYKSESFDQDGVIYVTDPTMDDDGGDAYTRNDFVILCDGDVVQAEMVWEIATWEHPDAILDQWDKGDQDEYDRRQLERMTNA